HGLEDVRDLLGVRGVGGVAREVDGHALVVGGDHVEGGDDRAGLPYDGGEASRRARVGREGQPDRDREPGTGKTRSGGASDAGGENAPFSRSRTTDCGATGHALPCAAIELERS
ncbi:hypothetical protein ADL26_05145, partial [Thermoactinomyces vulgaris]